MPYRPSVNTALWGLALLVAGVILLWKDSLGWAVTAAGAIAFLGGLVFAGADDVDDEGRPRRSSEV